MFEEKPILVVQDEAIVAARAVALGAYYHAGVINLPALQLN